MSEQNANFASEAFRKVYCVSTEDGLAFTHHDAPVPMADNLVLHVVPYGMNVPELVRLAISMTKQRCIEATGMRPRIAMFGNTNQILHDALGTDLISEQQPSQAIGDEQEAFEKWLQENGVEQPSRLRDGESYRASEIDWCWSGWKARAALTGHPAQGAEQAVSDGWQKELLDWVSACQSSYHIDSTPGHRFGGLGSNLEGNRAAVVEYVAELLAAAAQQQGRSA